MDQTETFEEPCYYCGLPGISTDHVVPTSLLEAVHDSGDEALIAAIVDKYRRMTVPCCRECNSVAGGKFDNTLAERKARIKDRLRVRHQRLLDMPDWHPHELVDMSPMLRNMILARLVQRDLLRRRLNW